MQNLQVSQRDQFALACLHRQRPSGSIPETSITADFPLRNGPSPNGPEGSHAPNRWAHGVDPMFEHLASPLPLPTTRIRYPGVWLGGGVGR